MPDSDLLPSLLYKIIENQLALDDSGQCRSDEVGGNVESALLTIDKNEAFI